MSAQCFKKNAERFYKVKKIWFQLLNVLIKLTIKSLESSLYNQFNPPQNLMACHKT